MSEHTPQELCQMFSAMELVTIIGSTLRTAQRYQSGESKPSIAITRLLWLIVNERIMPDSWPEQMRFVGKKLYTGCSDKPLTWQHLQQYDWVIGEWYHSMEFAGKLAKQVRNLKSKLPQEAQKNSISATASVIPFQKRGKGTHGWGVRGMRRK